MLEGVLRSDEGVIENDKPEGANERTGHRCDGRLGYGAEASTNERAVPVGRRKDVSKEASGPS
jgi:hypothetical protein